MAINALSPTALQDALFQNADKDRNGKLSGAEIKTAVAALTGNKAPSASDVAAVTQQLDTDGDNAISLKEFEQANTAATASATNPQLASAQNLLKALQAAGIGGGSSTGNPYVDLVQGSLGGTFTSTGNLVGQIVGGSIANKIV